MIHLELTQIQDPLPTGYGTETARVPEDTIVYAIGDIHGRLELLTALQQGIRENVRLHSAKHKHLIYLGDYFARGPCSRQVVDLLIEQPMSGFDAHHLKGNQEDIISQFLSGNLEKGKHWLKYGGFEGLASYGISIQPEDAEHEDQLEELRLRFVSQMTNEQRAFLNGLEIFRREGDYFFVHGGVDPSVPLEHQSDHDMMWIRDKFLNSDVDFGAIIVHGHTITENPVVKFNRIGIDTGAGRNQALTCLILEGENRWFLVAKPVS